MKGFHCSVHRKAGLSPHERSLAHERRAAATKFLTAAILASLPASSNAFYACDGGGNPSLPKCPEFNVTQPFPSISKISQNYASELESLKGNLTKARR
eukprot:CAMPEP_0196728746 /NCGR_PEP_ID=MMETSP1091-20130531/9340_1 /TAXON_ID=302021 /ORGANISM="Rhodomonas sp., Strain CCMP768" /LENGTH=97 /DNA_ID=CAMNT_0042071537 /DNA_START=98 /DNA_END=391 /DNA_ORIENTATION=-